MLKLVHWCILNVFLVCLGCGNFFLNSQEHPLQKQNIETSFQLQMGNDICSQMHNREIVIACVDECLPEIKSALNLVGEELNIQVRTISLMHNPNYRDAQYHGLILEGGADVGVDRYADIWSQYPHLSQLSKLAESGSTQKEKEYWHKKDLFEQDLLHNYFHDTRQKEIPMLAICRGMQITSVSQNLPLYVDIKTQLGIPNFNKVFDEIEIQKDSLMYSIYQKDHIKVFESHHQGMHYEYYKNNKEQFPHIKVTSSSYSDRIVEAIEFNNRKALGVQFHPELSSTDVLRPIFSWFVENSCQNPIQA